MNSMKSVLALAVSVLVCAPVWAGQHQAVAAVPKLVGRTVSNMVTFHNKPVALAEWANIGVAVADGVVSYNVLRRVPGSYEANPIAGKHPTMGTYLALTIPMGMYGAVLTQSMHERTAGRKSRWWTYTPLAVDGAIHGGAIAWNEHELRETCERANIACR